MKKLNLTALFLLTIFSVFSQTENKKSDAKGLSVGAIIPEFSALDADSNTFSISDALKQSPVVLVFYRGYWCPVCNEHLGKLQDSLNLIKDAGGRLIAVSPEKPVFLDKMAEKTGAEYTLLYDEDYKIAKAFDVIYKPKKTELVTYNLFLGAKLKKTHSDKTQQLPIPATFIINRNGKIIWRQFNPDYHKRSNVKEILIVLENLEN